MKPVLVTAPASIANLGPGFDCLGLAVDLCNTVKMSPADQGVSVAIDGEGSGSLPRGSRNLMVRAARRVFDLVGKAPRGLSLEVTNRIPLGSGLGSSAAAVVAGMTAANVMINGKLSREDLLRLAYNMEGHPDNAAASLNGGLNLVSTGSGTPVARQAPVADFRLIVALPLVQISTKEMRRALPRRVPLRDAVFNLGRALLTVEALRAGDYELLGLAMADRLHQTHRLRFIPGGEAAMAAARKAGAAGVALSGAGPAVVAFAPDRHERIARAMARTFKGAGLKVKTFVLKIDRHGSRSIQPKDKASSR
jgi:homoserine kinase